MEKFTLLAGLIFVLVCCNSIKPPADKIIRHAHIQTMDSAYSTAEAMAIIDGKIIAVGSVDQIDAYEGQDTEIIDAKGAYVLPGFIEGHGHFSALGSSLVHLNLLGINTWQTALDSVQKRVENTSEGRWISGRGWHQEKWDSLPIQTVDGYPTNRALNRIAPDHPVLLRHASGHALIANQKAIAKAGLDAQTESPDGGRILKDDRGRMTGVFEENAMELIQSEFQERQSRHSADDRYRDWLDYARRAQKQCFEHGITSFHDAGVSMEEIGWFQRAYSENALDIRSYVMLGAPLDSLKKYENKFPIKGAFEDRFTVQSVKAYVDGALGSYGAWMLEPYADKAGHTGQNVTSLDQLDSMAKWCFDQGMQFCTHAIGDRANREMLNLYEKYVNRPSAGDLRWRIEHAQHLSAQDISRFGALGIIPSMQAIHCTSDAAFFEKRLGKERSKEGAYAWNKLWENGAVVANGSDCPVESVDPLPCLYAAVSRKRHPGGRAYYPEMALSRKEALRSYTANNAFSSFQEDELGTLAPGKQADFILLSKNLEECPPEEILNAEVTATFLNGKKVYEQEE